MNVKTADLKNNLSRYLRRVRETGETLVVFDRNQPIATLNPVATGSDQDWQRFRAEALNRAKKIGLEIDIPPKRPARAAAPKVSPSLAPDRRSDISTTDWLRRGKDY